MLATSVAVHAPRATSSSSTGEGADDRSLSVSSGSAWPDGVMPRNRSSLTNLTVAFTPGADIDEENNTTLFGAMTCSCLQLGLSRYDRNVWPHIITYTLDITHELSNAISRKRLRHNPINTRRFLFVRSNSFTPTRNHGDRNARVDLPDLTREFPATHSRHADVSEDSIKLHFSKH